LLIIRKCIMASNILHERSVKAVEIGNPLGTQPTSFQIYKLGFLDSIKFGFLGHVKIGSISRGKHMINAYLFKCDLHGLQVSTPCGYDELLICPACFREGEAEPEHKKIQESNIEKIDSTKDLKKYLTKNIEKNK
jgi:hypothetical protein